MLGERSIRGTGQWVGLRFKHSGVSDGDRHGHCVGLRLRAHLRAAGQRRSPLLGVQRLWPTGDGTTSDSSIPVSVRGISTAIAITAGEEHTCALLRSGSVQCWGRNDEGELGNGTIRSSSVPVRVRTISTATHVAAGIRFTCALLSDGAMRCWGDDRYGQLGNRRKTKGNPNPWPVNVIGTPGVVWASSDPSKATITGHGLAKGLAVGNTTISATTAGFINDNAVLTVK